MTGFKDSQDESFDNEPDFSFRSIAYFIADISILLRDNFTSPDERTRLVKALLECSEKETVKLPLTQRDKRHYDVAQTMLLESICSPSGAPAPRPTHNS